MKRFVYFLIIAGACGYFGHRYWSSHRAQVDAWIQAMIGPVNGQPATTPLSELPAPGDLPPVPQNGRFAPPGIFYMLDRVSKTTETGVIGVAPGEQVRLMQRLAGGRLRITTGQHDFVVKTSQVTQDSDLALAARRRAGEAATLPR